MYIKKIQVTGADPGFFLGGVVVPLRNDVTDGEVKKFKSEYVYTKKKASSQGGGVRTPCTLPLDPPLSGIFHGISRESVA